MIFAKVKCATAGVGQFKDAGFLALLWKTFGIECFAFTRLLAGLYPHVLIVASHCQSQCTKTNFSGNALIRTEPFIFAGRENYAIHMPTSGITGGLESTTLL
jgi:hypothetical protein